MQTLAGNPSILSVNVNEKVHGLVFALFSSGKRIFLKHNRRRRGKVLGGKSLKNVE